MAEPIRWVPKGEPMPDLKEMSYGELCDRIEASEYRCEGGPLHNRLEWIELRRRLGAPGRWG